MENISNQEIDSELCTKCSTCGKPSWYIMKCDCGHIFCKHCIATDELDYDCINLECPKCGKSILYI